MVEGMRFVLLVVLLLKYRAKNILLLIPIVDTTLIAFVYVECDC